MEKHPVGSETATKAPVASASAKEVQPSWWSAHHASRWEHVKAQFRSAWEVAREVLSPEDDDLPIQAARDDDEPHGPDEVDLAESRAAHVASGESEEGYADTQYGGRLNEGWNEAEDEGRFGFSARSQYGELDDWTAELEATLRHEWERMHPARPFADARPGIRRGWDFTRPTRH